MKKLIFFLTFLLEFFVTEQKIERKSNIELFNEIRNKKYVIIGENHKDENVCKILVSLMNKKVFSSLYLEALEKGNLEKKNLRNEMGVYAHNPRKYDKIIEEALKKGMKIYGIDKPSMCHPIFYNPNIKCFTLKNENQKKRVSIWADYILTTASEKNLILVGKEHIEKHISNLPNELVSLGAKKKDILTIITETTKENKKNKKQGLYKRNEKWIFYY